MNEHLFSVHMFAEQMFHVKHFFKTLWFAEKFVSHFYERQKMSHP